MNTISVALPDELEGIDKNDVDDEFSREQFPPRLLRQMQDMNNHLIALKFNLLRKLLVPDHNLGQLIILFWVLTTLMTTFTTFETIVEVISTVLAAVFVLKVLKGMVGLLMGQRRLRKACVHATISKILNEGNADNFNYFVRCTKLALVINMFDSNTSALFTCPEALKMLNISNKATVLDALQKKGLRFSKELQKQVRNILLSCEGGELRSIKNMTDLGGDYQNLHKLIYTDIISLKFRNEILAHLRLEGEKMRKDNGDKAVGMKICSDIDDSLYSSGGSFPSGCDTHFPKHVVYPGVLALFKALDKQAMEEKNTCNLIFLSARPHAFKDFAEEHSYHIFAELVREGRMHTFPTLLPGKLWQGLQAIVLYPFLKHKAWRAVGELKTETFFEFADLYPEYSFVFCGDDGQGDVLAGEEMLKANRNHEIRAVFIHRVSPKFTMLVSGREEELPKTDDGWEHRKSKG
jgi:phosphatidate phosphatase APP1